MLFYQTHSIGQLLNIFTFDVDKVDLMVPKDVCAACISSPHTPLYLNGFRVYLDILDLNGCQSPGNWHELGI
jgi:hypothetical protein